MFIYVNMCVYMCIQVYIYMYTCISIYICIHIYIYIYYYMYVYLKGQGDLVRTPTTGEVGVLFGFWGLLAKSVVGP